MEADLSLIESPAVLLDHRKLLANIRSMQELADRHGVELRPHAKTHKSDLIAQLQIAEGARGVTVAKTDEAVRFITHGIHSVTVAYPVVVPSKLDRLFTTAAEHEAEIRLTLDSDVGADAIAAAARRHGATVGVLMKIDVGLRRCGVREDDPGLLPLVRRIDGDPSLEFLGFLSHAGQAYGAKDGETVREIAREECEILGRVRAKVEEAGIEVKVVSVGSTPTVLASESYEGITEIRPGNYTFMDRTPLRLGLISPDKLALSVLATVVSKNSDYHIIDAGSKVFSSDMGAHGTSGVADFGIAYPLQGYAAKRKSLSVLKLSEEHGFVERNSVDLPIGSQLRIIPNHSCVVANLVGEYTVLREDGAIETWPLAAQSCVR